MRRNLKGVMEKMKKLQRQLKEFERLYYIEVGKATEQCLKEEANMEVLKEKVKQIRKDFGKEE